MSPDGSPPRVIPITRPWLGEEEAAAARAAILSGWVTQGPRVREFEEAFAALVGAAHACAVSSCTTALHLALATVGVKPGDVVITASHSFIASANAIRHCGAEPFFVDIAAGSPNMDPGALDRALKEAFTEKDCGLWVRDPAALAAGESSLRGRPAPVGRLAAVLVVHQVGVPADLGRILPLARRHGLPVVEDAACAAGSEVSLDGGATREAVGRPHGDVACFSFHPRKLITTGDGGMLTTRREDYDARFRLLRQHGMSLSDRARHEADRVVVEEYLTTGFNYRMTDVQAALGLEQLKRLPRMLERRRELVARYRAGLSGLPGLSLPAEETHAGTNWQTFAIRLAAAERQRPVMQAVLKRGISTRRGIMCAHREAPYAAMWPEGCLPESEAASDRGVILPLYHDLSEAEQDRVIAALRELPA